MSYFTQALGTSDAVYDFLLCCASVADPEDGHVSTAPEIITSLRDILGHVLNSKWKNVATNLPKEARDRLSLAFQLTPS